MRAANCYFSHVWWRTQTLAPDWFWFEFGLVGDDSRYGANGRFPPKVRDETGDLLTPTHTQRHGRRIRYYVSNRLVTGGPDETGWRLPAKVLEDDRDNLLPVIPRNIPSS